MLIVALIILLLLVFFAMIYVFRRIINQNVTVATHHLDELNHDFEEKQKKIDVLLQEAKAQAQQITQKAGEEGEKQKTETIQAAEKERDKVIQEARTHAEEMVQQAEKSRYQLLADLDERIEKASVRKACELIGLVLPETFRKEVHAHWAQDLLKGGLSQLEQVRLPQELKEVKITSAFPLEEEERQALVKKIKAKVGNIPFKEEVDPAIVAGFVISLGSLMIDGSLKGKIEEQAKHVHSPGNT
jgi:F0F1-type ATP synthase delta subunit